MKTIVQTTIHHSQDTGKAFWCVSIAHRPDNALVGGEVVAWLVVGGVFASATGSTTPIRYLTPGSAAKAAEAALSVLKFSAAEMEVSK